MDNSFVLLYDMSPFTQGLFWTSVSLEKWNAFAKHLQYWAFWLSENNNIIIIIPFSFTVVRSWLVRQQVHTWHKAARLIQRGNAQESHTPYVRFESKTSAKQT